MILLVSRSSLLSTFEDSGRDVLNESFLLPRENELFLACNFRNKVGQRGLKSFVATVCPPFSMAYKASRDGLTQPDLNFDQYVRVAKAGRSNVESKLGLN